MKGGGHLSNIMALGIAIGISITVSVLLLIRIIYVLYRSGKPHGAKSPESYSTLVVLGSGELIIFSMLWHLWISGTYMLLLIFHPCWIL